MVCVCGHRKDAHGADGCTVEIAPEYRSVDRYLHHDAVQCHCQKFEEAGD